MKFLLIVTVFVYSAYAELFTLSDESIKAINDLETSWKVSILNLNVNP